VTSPPPCRPKLTFGLLGVLVVIMLVGRAGSSTPVLAGSWRPIAADPGHHLGEQVEVYGEVTQFDRATGMFSFRAEVDGVRHPVRYGFVDYPTNAFLTGDPRTFGGLAPGTLFSARVQVLGAYPYRTCRGVLLVVPRLRVAAITVLGSLVDD
jgi:hypothetical protein